MPKCRCGKVELELSRDPFLTAACCCNSCRDSAERFRRMPYGYDVRDDIGATPYALYRKDRVKILSGAEYLREMRLKPDSKTRRVVASCCNSPMFLEFKGGHWLSVYGNLWPDDAPIEPQVRTMTGDWPDQDALSKDIPNYSGLSPKFMWKLFSAWAAMGFRAPKIDVGQQTLEEPS